VFIFSLFFFSVIAFSILVLDQWIVEQTEKVTLQEIGFAVPTPAAYPLIGSVLGKQSRAEPPLSAHAAIIMDNDSKVTLFSKNQDLRFSMASTTKIMTALVALEYFNLYDVLTMQEDSVEGAVVGFKKGEQVFFEDMLYAMLLPSGNDAALAIAQNYQGGEKAFVEKMNQKAESLHLLHTHYADSSGLNDKGDYTTVVDLARLAAVGLKDPVLSRIVGTKQKVIRTLQGNIYTLVNLNKLLGQDGVYGMKTGFTDEAGGVLVTLKKEGEKTFIVVVMKSVDRFADTEALLSLISGNAQFQSMHQ